MNREDINSIRPLGLETIPTKRDEVKMDYKENIKGIDSTKKIFSFFVSLFTAVKEAKKTDGKISYDDFVWFLPLIKDLPSMLTAFNDVPKEILDTISDEEFQQLSAILESAGFIADQEIEELVIETLQLVVHCKNFYFNRFAHK